MAKTVKKYFRPEVLKQKAYHLERYPGVVKLNQNELAHDFTPAMKQQWLKALRNIPMNRYPEVRPSRLTAALARSLKVKPSQILVAPGSNLMISSLISAAAVKQKVMAPDPSFGLYIYGAEALGNRFIPLELDPSDWSWEIQAVLKNIRRTKPQIIFIANPNAPTGNLFPKEDLLKIIETAPSLVVVDEAYYHFSGVTLLPKLRRYPNLVLLRTFSKAMGLGGGRLGYMIARPEVTAQVEKMLVPYCVNPFSEEAALVALKHQGYFKKIIREVTRERERVFLELASLSNLQPYPSEANFLLIRVRSLKRCLDYLLKQRVLVRDMSSHPKLKGCFRVTIGRPKENNAFLKAIRSFR